MRYAGIGPRNTLVAVQAQMTVMGRMLHEMGFILCSGDGIGADQAWAEDVPPSATEIFVVEPKPNCPHGQIPVWTQEQWDFADKHFTKFRGKLSLDSQNEYIQGLFCRNLNVLLGADLQEPVDFVAYWYDKDCPEGWASGTGHTVSMAREMGIPCFNIYFGAEQKAMEAFIEQLLTQHANSVGE